MKLKALALMLFTAGVLAGSTLIAPATGADSPTTTSATTTTTTTPTPSTAGATDPISSRSATSITVGPLTCSIGPSSPNVEFKIGDRVRIGCVNGSLYYIVSADTPPATTTAPTTTTPSTGQTFTTSGVITALSATGIRVDDFFCAVYTGNYTGASPDPIALGFHVGDHVGIACLNGALQKIGAFDQSSGGDSVKTTKGPITAINATSITVNDFTCTLNSSSPSVTQFKLGDVVGVACQNGVLVKIGAVQSDQLQVRLGTISALSATSITVDGLTCSIGSSSPSTTAFKVGDSVGIGCSSGTLVKIGTPKVDDGGFKVAIQLGTISAVSATSITVGSLTCELAATSPSVAAFSTGDRVGIGCAGGILFMVGALPSPQAAPTPKVRLALFARLNSCVKSGTERCSVESVLRRFVKKH